ncbi:unnamed protein product [Linum trigynum]|uniref:Uncharacterized protein n=1 Tax=Linum trigynum TaxID=586398 RepID=A0AAV2D814_9ROSI
MDLAMVNQHEQVDEIIMEAAKATHGKKLRARRSMQEMEAHRIGPVQPTLQGPRRCRSSKKGCGGDISGSDGY